MVKIRGGKVQICGLIAYSMVCQSFLNPLFQYNSDTISHLAL